MDIGAADIHFQPAHLLLLIQQTAGIGVVFHGKTAHIGHYRLVETFFQFGQFPGNHLLHSGILQTHRIDKTRSALRNPGGGISKPGFPGGTLKGEGPQAVDVVKLRIFIAEPKGSAGGNDGIFQGNPAQIHTQLSHRISSFRMTGPSLQIRL